MVAITFTCHEFFTYVLCGITSEEEIDFFYELNIPFSNFTKIKSSIQGRKSLVRNKWLELLQFPFIKGLKVGIIER